MALTQKEANMQISNKIAQAQALIKECEKIADEGQVGFSIEFGGYGSGSYYTPREPRPDDADEDWNSSSEGWQASSQSC